MSSCLGIGGKLGEGGWFRVGCPAPVYFGGVAVVDVFLRLLSSFINTAATDLLEMKLLDGYSYFVVKTAMPSPFSAKKWPHGRKAKRKTVSDFVSTERLSKEI